MSDDQSAEPALTRRSWAVLAVLFLLQITWSMDRTLPFLLVEPLREAFKLSDSQLGLVVGMAYGVAYGVGGLLVGPLLDRFNRTRMLAGMLVCWSALTAVCGMVSNFPLLLLARIGVGAAESGGSPASYAIVSDVFPKDRRATAIGLFKVGSPLGVLAATVIGGTIAVEYGWRAAFLVAGVPGLFLAIAVIMVIPGGRRADARPQAAPYSLREAIRFMARAPGVAPLMAAIILYMFANAGAGAFVMPHFQRVHDVSLKNMSFLYGLGTALSCLGPIGAALISDRLARRDLRYTLHLFSIIAVSCFISISVMALAGGVTAALAGMMAWQLISASMSAPAFGTLLSLTPPQMRGTVVGFLSACMYLLGIGPAPFFTGLVSDALGGEDMVRYALVIAGSVNLFGIAGFWLSAGALKRAAMSHSTEASRLASASQ